ncbi:MAG: transcription elongation factor spt5 [Phylliscum demangeonii]|nr:MAG: transcription elongation factor spt5 [Phylliscum demangeonii]
MNGSMPPPAPRPMGRDRAVGKTVTIRQGPYKGMLGIVVDTTDLQARVELHARAKIVAVPKECLGIKDDRPLTFFNAAPAAATGIATVMHGGRTLAWKQDALGGRTPGYGTADGGRTPAFGGQTSNGGHGDGGGRTPFQMGNTGMGNMGAMGNGMADSWNPGAPGAGSSSSAGGGGSGGWGVGGVGGVGCGYGGGGDWQGSRTPGPAAADPSYS